MPEVRHIKYCQDVEGPGKPDCCNSCHEDNELGFSDLADVYDAKTDEITHSVCCTVKTWIGAQK